MAFTFCGVALPNPFFLAPMAGVTTRSFRTIALARAREAGAERLRVFSDSELLVNQVNGRYKARQPHLQQYLQEAIRIMRDIPRVDVAHVRREVNGDADALANRAIDDHHRKRS